MSIQWFPGHMNKARREIRQAMPKVDLVIEVLDARMPFSSENPLVPELRGAKPLIRILNKSDLADPAVTAAWLRHLSGSPEVRAFAHHARQPGLMQAVMGIARELVPPVRVRPMAAMILGVPNVGKSTLINALAARTLAKTENRPAVTQRQQQIRVGSDLILIDTPGFLWPKLSPPDCGYRLALLGSVPDRLVDPEALAYFAVRFLAASYPAALGQFYGIRELPSDAPQIVEAIGRSRGFLQKGGVVDQRRAAERLILDFRSGNFGLISLERPRVAPAPEPEEEPVTAPESAYISEESTPEG